MGASGQGSLSSAPRTPVIPAPPPPGPPFDPDSAENGVSVDPVSGSIVLGNRVGFNQATLISNREIPMQNFNIRFSKPSGSLSIFGGNTSGSIDDVDTNNFYAGYTTLNRSAGNAAISYSGVYNDLNNALLLIAASSNYNQGGASYDSNALMLYADSQSAPFSDLYVACDANIRFLTQGLNRSFEKMTLFAGGNLRLALDGVDDFSAKLQVVGDIDNIANFMDNGGTSQAAFSSVGNLVLAQGAAFADTGERLQIQTQAIEAALSIQNNFGDRYAYMYANGNFTIGPGFSDNGQSFQIQAKAGQAPLYIETFAGGSQLAQMFSNGNLRLGVGADSGARYQVRGSGGNIVEYRDSADGLRFSISNTGVVTLATVVTAAPAVAMVKNIGNNQVQHIAGFSGTVTPVTSITVLNGIVTAVS